MSESTVSTTPWDYITTIDEDYDSDLCNKTAVVRFDASVTPSIFILITMFSCVGNLLVLGILFKYENLISLTNTFLINLVISDLIFTVGLPFWAFNHGSGWIFGEMACKSVSFIFFLGYYSGILFLTMMTVHRYMAVVHPLTMILNRRRCCCILMSAFIWSLSICAAAPDFIFKSVSNQTGSADPMMHCDHVGETFTWKLIGIYQQNLFFLISFFIITFCYVQILRRLLRPTSHTRPKTFRLIFCIVIVFFLGWAPYNVSIFIDSLVTWQISAASDCDVNNTMKYVYTISRLVAYSHCCLNPVFYAFMGIKFRSHLKTMLRGVSQRQEQSSRHSHLILSNGEEISMY